MFKAHPAPRQWEVPGAVLDVDNVLVGPLRIQTAPTATERMQDPSGRGKLLRLFPDLQDIVLLGPCLQEPGHAGILPSWSSNICRCSFVLSAQQHQLASHPARVRDQVRQSASTRRGLLRQCFPTNLVRSMASMRGIQRGPSVLPTSPARKRLGNGPGRSQLDGSRPSRDVFAAQIPGNSKRAEFQACRPSP